MYLDDKIMDRLRYLEKSLDSFKSNFAKSILRNAEISEKQLTMLGKLCYQEKHQYDLTPYDKSAEYQSEINSSDTFYNPYDQG